MKRMLLLLFLCPLLGMGCAAGRVVRLDTGDGWPITFKPPKDVEPIEIKESEFLRTINMLVLEMNMDLRSSAESPRYPLAVLRGEQLRPRFRLAAALQSDGFTEETGRPGKYHDWCQRQRAPFECVQLLEGGLPSSSASERLNLAVSFAMGSVMEGAAGAVKDLVNPLALTTMIATAMVVYMTMLVIPEPISKIVALSLTVAMVAYVGAETLFHIIDGWRRLTTEAKMALSFSELQDSGERFGKVMGRDVARLFIMAATALATGGTANLAAKAPSFPGFTAAVVGSEVNGGMLLAPALSGGVRSITITSGAINVALAPNVVAMGAAGRIPAGKGPPTPRNASLVGKKHPKTGIPFDEQGYPDFSSVTKIQVKIKQTGNRPADFRASNKAARIAEEPEGYTWHHHQDGTTMQLVPQKLHADTGHTGGFCPSGG